jgi:putative ABC transport system permease protein
MLRASLRSLLSHKVRLLLTALAIALGVAFMSGTFTFTATLRYDLDALFRTVNAATDVIVQHGAPAGESGGTAGARPTVAADLLPAIQAVPGVRAAEGVVIDQAQLTTVDGGLAGSGPGLATSWRTDAALAAGYPLRAGRAPRTPGEVAIDQGSATAYGYRVGDPVRMVIQGQATRFTIVGLVGFGTGKGAGRSLTMFAADTAPELFGKSGRYDRIEVEAAPGVASDALRDRIAAVLPAGVDAITGATAAADQSASLRGDLSFLTDALLAFAAIALFVGAFVIWNTFSILVAQRTRELALLRALGASRRQLFGGVLAEAGLVGLASSIAGVGLGLLAAQGLATLLRTFGLDLPSHGPRVPVTGTALAVLTGSVVTVLAALAPARRAVRVAPVAAMREVAPAPYTFSRRRLGIGLAVTAAGLAALVAALSGHVATGAAMAGAGALAVVLGVNLLAPLVARPLIRLIGAPLRRLPARTGRLAQDNAAHNPGRTAATAAALMIGLAAVAGSTVLINSVKAGAAGDIGRASRADLYITAGGGEDGVLNPGLARAVATRAGVAATAEVRRSEATVAGSTHQTVYGIDPATITRLTDLGVRTGALADLRTGAMLVSTSAARAHKWHTGSAVTVQFGQASQRTITVAGTFADKGPLGDYLLGLDTFDAATNRPLDSLILVKATPGTSVSDLRGDLTGLLASYPGAQVLDTAGFQSASGAGLDQILNLTTGLLVLAVVIALLGIVNTLALAVTERTRELGVLRAIGMRRGQLAATVTVEAGMIAVFGGLLGLGVGTGLGGALAATLTDTHGIAVPVPQLATYLVIAVLAAMLAAAAPARRAARMDMLRAITSE